MKTCEQKFNSVMAKIEKENTIRAEREKKVKTVSKYASVACVVTLVLVGAFSFGKYYSDLNSMTIGTESEKTSKAEESEYNIETDGFVKPDAETKKDIGGSSIYPKGSCSWDETYYTPPFAVVNYVGTEITAEWWGWYDEEKIPHGTTYDYVRKFNIPREMFEVATYTADLYATTVNTDLVYGDDEEAYDDFYLNHLEEHYEWHRKMYCEEQFIFWLFVNDTLGEYKDEIYEIMDEVNKKFPEEIYHGALPDYSGIFSIPEIIYIYDLSKEDVYNYYNRAIGNAEMCYKYDIESIFNEREKYEKLIADARAMEDPIEMLKATRAINEMLRIG